MSTEQPRSPHEPRQRPGGATPDTLGYLAAGLSLIVPFVAIPIAIYALRKAHIVGVRSTPAIWGLVISVVFSAALAFIVFAGVVATNPG